MFYSAGNIVLDVVLRRGKETRYPYGEFIDTPHHGRVACDSVIETRGPKE
jgi:hypothetical protein